MFRHALVLGKFYPPHAGHHRLVRAAAARSARVAVWELHVGIMRAVLARRAIQDGDPRRPPWTPSSPRRTTAPSWPTGSGPSTCPSTRTGGGGRLRDGGDRGLCARIVVVGAESTGTTTLSRALADHYDAPWVAEEGRRHSEDRLAAATALAGGVAPALDDSSGPSATSSTPLPGTSIRSSADLDTPERLPRCTRARPNPFPGSPDAAGTRWPPNRTRGTSSTRKTSSPTRTNRAATVTATAPRHRPPAASARSSRSC